LAGSVGVVKFAEMRKRLLTSSAKAGGSLGAVGGFHPSHPG